MGVLLGVRLWKPLSEWDSLAQAASALDGEPKP
jgi:hypothetical protein